MTRDRVVLFVDDEERIRRVLQAALCACGYEIVTAVDGEDAIKKLDASVDLVLTDLKMPRKGGMAILSHVRQAGLGIPVILMTAFGTVNSAVAAMKEGAYDYVTKPFNLDEVEILVDRALESQRVAVEHRYLREAARNRLEDMIGRSPAMQSMFGKIRRVAVTDSGALITGETGAGKELVARAIHSLSPRAGRLFVPVNCAAIPRDLLESELFGHTKGAFTGATENRIGKFELASGGTLFLDEIGDMAPDLQAKILRVLDDGRMVRVGTNREIPVDVRVISATNRNLEEAIAAGRFRDDLYYRLNVIHLRLPPLRERPDDVELLAEHFLHAAAARIGRPPLALDRDAAAFLREYAWPGNVRELRNVCERLTVLCESDAASAKVVAHLLDLPEASPPQDRAHPEESNLADAVIQVEIDMINKALAQTLGHKARAAKLLGISERNFWYKLKRYGSRIGGEHDRGD